MLLIHDLAPFANGEIAVLGNVAQLSAYNWRSLVFAPTDRLGRPNTAVVTDHPCIEAYMKELKRINVGVKNVIPLRSKNLYGDITTKDITVIEPQWRHNFYRIAPFVSCPSSWQMADRLGLSREQFYTQDLEIFRCLEHKIRLRQLTTSKVFCEYRTARSAADIKRNIAEMLQASPQGLLVRHPCMASGAGTIKVHSLHEPCLREFMKKYGQEEIIIEEIFPRPFVDFAIHTWYFAAANSRLEYQIIYATRQYMEPDGVTFAGALVCRRLEFCLPFHWNQAQKRQVSKNIIEEAKTIFNWAATQPNYGGLGRLGLEGMISPDGSNWKFCEATARYGGSHPAASFLRHLREQWQLPEETAAVIMNIKPPFNKWGDLKEWLEREGYYFNPKTGLGAIIVLPNCLEDEKPKCALLGSWGNTRQTHQKIWEIKERLEERR